MLPSHQEIVEKVLGHTLHGKYNFTFLSLCQEESNTCFVLFFVFIFFSPSLNTLVVQ